MGRYILLASLATKLRFSSWVQYRTDYIAGLVTVILDQLLTLTLLGVIFTNVQSVAGWTWPEVLMLYGFTRAALGIADAISEGLWFVGNHAQDGSLVQYLLQPISVLFQLIVEQLYFERFANSLIGIAFIVYGSMIAGFAWGLPDILLALLFILLGTLIYLGIMILGAGLAVIFTGGTGIVQSIWSLTEFAKYPLPVYGRLGTFIFSTVLPLAVIGTFPAAALLKPSELAPNTSIIVWSTFVTVIFYSFCLLIWRVALRRYEGTGS